MISIAKNFNPHLEKAEQEAKIQMGLPVATLFAPHGGQNPPPRIWINLFKMLSG